MVTIPAKIMEKYGLRQGSKVEFVETEEGLLLFPVKTLKELRGAFKNHEKSIQEGIRELELEHKEEARS
jgi:AbrB family looped-hinge helix DNA binding protein